MNARIRMALLTTLVALVAASGRPAGAVMLNFGPEMWLRADAGIVHGVGSNVETWGDQSGNGHDALQSNNDFRPALVANAMNGQPVIRFNGTQQYLVVDDASGLNFPDNQSTIFFVLSTNTPTTTQRYFSKQDGSQISTAAGYQHTIYAAAGNRIAATLGDGSAASVLQIDDATVDLSTGTPLMLRHRADGLAHSYTKDGLLLGAQALGALGDTTGPNDIWIGRSPTQGQNLNGDFAEIVVFNRALNAAELVIAENHLSAKYNLGSVVSGPDRLLDPSVNRYAGNTTPNGNYDLDVFGIGRVDAAQVASTSAAGLTITAASGLQDGQWVLAGHRAAANDMTAELLSDGQAGRRMERVWYIDKTDPASNGVDVTLTFDFFAAGLGAPTLGPLEAYFLLYSASDPYDFAIIAGGSGPPDAVSFFVPGGLLLDGYYTIGIFTVPEPSTAALLLLGWVAAGGRRKRRNGPLHHFPRLRS